MHSSSGCKHLPTNPLIGETFSHFPPELCVSGYRLCGMRAAAAWKAISLFTPHTGLFISQQGHHNVFEAQRAQPKCVGCVNAPLTRIKCLQWVFSFFFFLNILFDKAVESALPVLWQVSRLAKAPVVSILSGADSAQWGKRTVHCGRLLRLAQQAFVQSNSTVWNANTSDPSALAMHQQW